MTCPYCQKEAKWLDNAEVYGKRYGKSYMMYWCKDCDARVGCHQNTTKPLGTMANAELRTWRIKVHVLIDPLWKSGKLTRKKVYQQLNKILGKEIHVGESDIETCKLIIENFPNLLK